jgi:hypothetical protein
MNVLPVNLIGKTIADCYESDKDTVTMEFTDGSKIDLIFPDYFIYVKHQTKEPEINLLSKN